MPTITVKGTVKHKENVKVTNKGNAYCKISFKQSTGGLIFPQAQRENVNLLNDINPGDEIELTYLVKTDQKKTHFLIIKDLKKA